MDQLLNTLSHITGFQLVLLVILFPLIFLLIIFGWMLLVARGRSTTAVCIAGFGVSLSLTASRPPPEVLQLEQT